MTVSPYLGPGSLQPAVDTARQHGGGLFVLARTSNPDAGTLQHALVGDRSVAQVVVDTVRGWNTPGWVVGDPLPDVAAVRDLAAVGPSTGSFGVVVGATLRELDVDLDGLGGPVLAPGLGAQGGSVADLRRLFGAGTAVVPTVSRDVLAAGPDAAGAAGRGRPLDGGARRVRRLGRRPQRFRRSGVVSLPGSDCLACRTGVSDTDRPHPPRACGDRRDLHR